MLPVHRTCPTLAIDPSLVAAPGVRARVWLRAEHFFSRSDARHSCWLWLLDLHGRVQALRLPAALHGRDDLLPTLRRHAAAHGHFRLGDMQESIVVLPAAPAIALPRWAISWGQPVQQALRAFAACLDQDILTTLGALEQGGGYFGNVANYTHLAGLDARRRTHRIQALAHFPPLVAPLLLERFERPDMFGDVGMPGGRTDPERCADVLDAIDHGRDLVGALARYHRIDRALVRSTLCRSAWPEGEIPFRELRLLHAMPAHVRPARVAQVSERAALLDALPLRLRDEADLNLLGMAFQQGWDSTWQALEAEFAYLPNALRDCRDFLAAALDHAIGQGEASGPGLLDLTPDALGLAWVAQRGLRSLLAASRRWHIRPLAPRIVRAATASESVAIAPLFGELVLPEGRARELGTRPELAQEGDLMHHCVGDYWHDVLCHGHCIVHLETTEDEDATAQYIPCGLSRCEEYELEQLRGPCNAEVSEAMEMLAERLLEAINAPERRAARQARREAAGERHRQLEPHAPVAPGRRPLDGRSRRELSHVLQWAMARDDFRPTAGELILPITGFVYAEGPRLGARLRTGEALCLVREPDIPHDPNAIRIDWQGHRLGYVPRARNRHLAHALDAGQAFSARLHAHRPASHASPPEIAIRPCDAPPGAATADSTAQARA